MIHAFLVIVLKLFSHYDFYVPSVQIKALLMAVKDFNPNCGDSTYTMGIVDLLVECVELSYRPGNWFISLPSLVQLNISSLCCVVLI